MATAGAASEPDDDMEGREAPTIAGAETVENEGMAAVQPPEEPEEDIPQTQMAAAFAAFNMDQLASDTPPEETKA
jgi:hypothetical protein